MSEYNPSDIAINRLQPSGQLIDHKGMSKDERLALHKVYDMMDAFLKRPDLYSDDPDEIVARVHGLESAMQVLWGFDVDPKHWYYEFDLKGCTCPKLNNLDLRGTSQRVYSEDCPYHGVKTEE